MTASEFKQEILAHYLDEDCQITIDRNPTRWSSGNGLVHTGLFYTLLAINDLIDKEDIKRFSRAVDLCWKGSYDDPIHGLLERNDGRPDLEAHDDYHVATASLLLKTYHAEAIYNYGHEHWWAYNNVDPGKFTFQTFHARFPGHLAYLSIAANREPDCINGFILRKKMQRGPGERSDSAMMDFLKAQAMLQFSESYKIAANLWLGKAEDKYQTLGKALEGYFGSTHPFAKVPTIKGIWQDGPKRIT